MIIQYIANRISNIAYRTSHILCLVSCVLILLSACKTPKHIPAIPINTIERVVERFVPVEIPADSAVLTALFACDSLNNVYIKAINESKTKRVESSVKLDNNTLIYRTKTLHDTVYLKSDSIFIYQEKPVPAPYPVERELTYWQKIRINIGGWGLLVFALFAAWKLRRLFRKS